MAYCDQVQGCGHWLVLGDLEGQVGLADPSPLGVPVDLGGLRGKEDRYVTKMMRYVKKILTLTILQDTKMIKERTNTERKQLR